MSSPIRLLHNELINLKTKLDEATSAVSSTMLDVENWDASIILIQESAGVSVILTAVNTNNTPNVSQLRSAIEAYSLSITLASTSIARTIIDLAGYYGLGEDSCTISSNTCTIKLQLKQNSSGSYLALSSNSSINASSTAHMGFSIRGFIPEATINV